MSESTAVQKARETTPVDTTVPVKTAPPESLVHSMDEVFDAISRRAYELFENNGHMFGRDLENWFKAEQEMFHPLHVEITETDDTVSVKAEVPGFTEKDLQITMEPERLTISGRRETTKQEKEGREGVFRNLLQRNLSRRGIARRSGTRTRPPRHSRTAFWS